MRGSQGAQVVGGLQAHAPGQHVHLVQLAARGLIQVQVERLTHVNPLLPPGGAVDEPLGVDFKRGAVLAFDFLGDAGDGFQHAVEVLQRFEQLVPPEPQPLQVAHQVAVHLGELAREVALGVQVAERRFDGLGNAHDVGNGGRGSDGHYVAVAHAVLGHRLAHQRPVQVLRAVHLDRLAALFFQQVNRVDGQQPPVPFGPAVAGILAPLPGQFGRGEDGKVADCLGAAVGKLDRLFGLVGKSQLVQCVLEAHNSQPDGPVPQVASPGFFGGVVVDVDYVVQHPHGGADGLFQQLQVELAVADVGRQVD